MKPFGLKIMILLTITFLFAGCNQSQDDNQKESAYDRIIKSGKIRVGYVSVPPGCIVDPNSKKLSGITIEILNKIAENTKLKVEYTEEVGWGTMIEGLNAGRYDMMGNNSWANPIRGKLALLSEPIYYSGIGIWVRKDDNRFNNNSNWLSINSPNVRLGVMDGSTGLVIAIEQFPNAKKVTFTDITGEPQLFLELVAKKVDVVFAEPVQGSDFLKTNPGEIKNIAANDPIRIFANVYLFPTNEFQLKSMIDIALEDLQNSGYVDKILKKYENNRKLFYRVNVPYRSTTN